MSDLKKFGREFKIKANRQAKNIDKLVRMVYLAVDQAVVLATPVDTGRARGNWRGKLGAMEVETLPEPSSPGEGAARSLKEGENVARSYGESTAGQVMHITNNLPYIQYLNEGSSKQAPIDFVNIAIHNALSVIRGKGNTIKWR